MSRQTSSWRDSVAQHKFSFLLIALLFLVLAPLLVGTNELIFGLTFLGVLVFGIYATVQHRRVLTVSLLLGVPAGLAQLSSFAFGAGYYPEVRLAVFAAFLGFLAGAIIRDVVLAEAVTWDKIQGAMCAYLVIGVAWGLLYTWVGMNDPQAFSGAVQTSTEPLFEQMIYYSFVTLTTLGYGDITPVSHTARTLAWLEAVFGQIYLVVLVARLVSLQLIKSSHGDP